MAIIRQCYAEGRPLPARIANAPEVKPEEHFYWQAFWELHTCRLADLGPIPWTAIDQYGQRYAEDDEQAECLVDVIRRVDDWYIERKLRAMEKETKSAKGKGRIKPKVTPKK